MLQQHWIFACCGHIEPLYLTGRMDFHSPRAHTAFFVASTYNLEWYVTTIKQKQPYSY